MTKNVLNYKHNQSQVSMLCTESVAYAQCPMLLCYPNLSLPAPKGHPGIRPTQTRGHGIRKPILLCTKMLPGSHRRLKQQNPRIMYIIN